jgi:SAM-dependent methyltransferase
MMSAQHYSRGWRSSAVLSHGTDGRHRTVSCEHEAARLLTAHPMDTAAAIRQLQTDPVLGERITDSYLGGTPLDDAECFRTSAEFSEIHRLTTPRGRVVADIGAGRGNCVIRLRDHGSRTCTAVEPNGGEFGRGAIHQLGLAQIVAIDAAGEVVPLPSKSADVVYAQQVLHHASDLVALVNEAGRLLRTRGLFVASREHVVDDDRQLTEFLADHALAGGEHAYWLDAYLTAIGRPASSSNIFSVPGTAWLGLGGRPDTSGVRAAAA